MEDKKIIRQIRGKGNGQAIIYVTQQNLKDLDCGIDDLVEIKKRGN